MCPYIHIRLYLEPCDPPFQSLHSLLCSPSRVAPPVCSRPYFADEDLVKMAPKVVTDVDEAELARQMDLLEQENEQVAGDSASEDDDDDDESDDGANSEEDGGSSAAVTKTSKKKAALDDDPKIKAISGLMADASLGAEGADDDQNWD